MIDKTPTTPYDGKRNSRLIRHVAVILVIKLVLLTLLWYAFIKPYKVTVDVDAMSSRMSGNSSQPPQEKTNDRLDGR